MKCADCGSDVYPGEKFCGSCGARVVEDSKPPASTPQQPANSDKQKKRRNIIITVVVIVVVLAAAAAGWLVLAPGKQLADNTYTSVPPANLFSPPVNDSHTPVVETPTETPSETPSETPMETPAEMPKDEQVAAPPELSDDLYSFQFFSDGKIYQLPMTYPDMIALGWEIRDFDPSTILPDNCSTNVYIKTGKYEDYVGMYNYSGKDQPLEECYIGSLTIYDNSWPLDSPCFFPKGIQFGVSGTNDLIAAYGVPTNRYDGDTITILTYQYDQDRDITFTISNESDSISEIRIHNETVPDSNIALPATPEVDWADAPVPDSIQQYQRPDGLADDITQFTLMFDGDLYNLPFPVNELVANGWEIAAKDSDLSIDARSYGYVLLRNGNVSFRTIIYNTATFATSPQNCWIEDFTMIDDPESGLVGFLRGKWQLSLGIASGMTGDELESHLQGIEYKKTGNAYETYYDFMISNGGNEYSLSICADTRDDGVTIVRRAQFIPKF